MYNSLRVFLFLLALSLAFTVSGFAAYNDNNPALKEWNVSAEAGVDDITASLYALDGTADRFILVISGSGNMLDFSSFSDVPWYNGYSERITSVTVESGVNNIGENTISCLAALKEVFIYNRDIELSMNVDSLGPSSAVICSHQNSMAHTYADLYQRIFRIVCKFSDMPCAVCGYRCEEGAPSCSTGGICYACGTTHSDMVRHTSDGVLRQEISPTCESDGVKAHYVCSDCGALLDEDENPITDTLIPAYSHSFSELKEGISPTCVDPGTLSHYLCLRCGSFFDSNKNKITEATINPLGHTGGCATCAEPAVCDICGISYGLKNPDNHIFSSDFVYDESGHGNLCECGESSEFILHNYTETVLQPATEHSDGILKRHCDCGYEERERIPKLSYKENNAPPKSSEGEKTVAVIILSVAGVFFVSLSVILFKKFKKQGENNV